jgi:lipopolysaccharide transport system ATP-binding protein
MSDIVIKVENVSKQYRLGDIGTGSLKDDIKRWRYQMMGREDPFLTIGEENDRTVKTDQQYVWALKDINFEVKQGEVLGIIGRNGAGKSTLLKILSRTTGPTTGSVKVKGRIASLLEVGTGFHGELSGRDNIYLNGAIMGMTKAEIKAKFDEIVDFAGVEKYIDTPVKRYSSGMYVRLAFGVAAHLEPEILIVDEVLAVGDAEFQKKAIGKMKDVSNLDGRTVLVVSHNMGTLAQLCSSAILMQNGKIIKQDHTEKVIDYYLRNAKKNQDGFSTSEIDKDISIIEAFIQNEEGVKTLNFTHLQKIKVVVKMHVNKWIKDAELRLVVRDLNGKVIFVSDLPLKLNPNSSKLLIAVAEISEHFLRPGSYSFSFFTFVHDRYVIHILENILSIDIIDGGSKYASSEGLDYGYIYYDPKWHLQDF